MPASRRIQLTRAQLDRAWELTQALVQNDGATRKSLDLVFIQASRFVARVEGGIASEGRVLLDSGKSDAHGRVHFEVVLTDEEGSEA